MPDDDNKLSGADIQELEILTELLQSQGWRVLKNLLYKHRIYCVDRSNKHLELHEDRKAGEWLARSKEPQKMITIAHNRKKELSDQLEKERG